MIDEQKQPETTAENQDAVSAESEATENKSGETNSSESYVESTDNSQKTDLEPVAVDNSVAETLESESDLLKENEQIIAALQQDNANLKHLLDQQTEQTNALKAQYARLGADFDNFRKRTIKEKENLEEQAKKAIISELLPVVDNFERARTQIKPTNEGEKAIHNSYQGVYKTLVDSLKRLGVSAMRPEGQEFDPNYHEAMLREATNEYPEGTVIEQLMRGYLLGEQVLRHAMVKVAVPQEPVITSEEENTTENNQTNEVDS
jgi:molecular chaperone GrpE